MYSTKLIGECVSIALNDKRGYVKKFSLFSLTGQKLNSYNLVNIQSSKIINWILRTSFSHFSHLRGLVCVVRVLTLKSLLQELFKFHSEDVLLFFYYLVLSIWFHACLSLADYKRAELICIYLYFIWILLRFSLSLEIVNYISERIWTQIIQGVLTAESCCHHDISLL